MLQVPVDAGNVVHQASVDFVQAIELVYVMQPEFGEGIDAASDPVVDFGLDVGSPQQVGTCRHLGHVVHWRRLVHVIAPAAMLGAVPAACTSVGALV